MILFVFPVFCLTWQRGRERAAGSLQFELGGFCSHTQALKQVQALVLGMPFLGALLCKSKVWEAFPFAGLARRGWHFTYSCITNISQIQVKGQAYQMNDTLRSGIREWVVKFIWTTLSCVIT